jgi:hypothetical protein
VHARKLNSPYILIGTDNSNLKIKKYGVKVKSSPKKATPVGFIKLSALGAQIPMTKGPDGKC